MTSTSTDTGHLVLSYLEKVSSKVFEDFSQEITSLADGQQGVYALYKGDRLYYVGLASNLKNRVKQHLKDKHAGKWNKFSVYLVRESDRIKELEALILRVADPKGNKVKGGLPRAKNLKPVLRRRMEERTKRKIARVLGHGDKGNAKPKTARKKPAKWVNAQATKAGGKQPALAPYVTKRFMLRGSLKGKNYQAWVHKSGIIQFEGKKYHSPSGAAVAALERPTNGWTFWKFKRDGEWVRLDELRGGRTT